MLYVEFRCGGMQTNKNAGFESVGEEIESAATHHVNMMTGIQKSVHSTPPHFQSIVLPQGIVGGFCSDRSDIRRRSGDQGAQSLTYLLSHCESGFTISSQLRARCARDSIDFDSNHRQTVDRTATATSPNPKTPRSMIPLDATASHGLTWDQTTNRLIANPHRLSPRPAL